MGSVIELQRQLLTTVMENEVYKTQLERVSEGWKSRIGDFERVNTSLQTEVTKLQLENQDLKSKVNKHVVDLEAAKARLRVVEKHASSSSSAASRAGSSGQLQPQVKPPRNL